MTVKKHRRTAKPLYDDPEQSKAFVGMAQEIGADESGEEFRRALKRITPASKKPDGS